jgi:hypothetical protein
MEIRVPHQLERDEAVRRLLAAAERLELSMRPGADANQGRVTKATPLGPVEASWQAHATEICVIIDTKPAFLPGPMVERMLKEGLTDALA